MNSESSLLGMAVVADAHGASDNESMDGDDGLNDIYSETEDNQPQLTTTAESNPELAAANDDYAKSFDSPDPDADADGEFEYDEPQMNVYSSAPAPSASAPLNSALPPASVDVDKPSPNPSPPELPEPSPPQQEVSATSVQHNHGAESVSPRQDNQAQTRQKTQEQPKGDVESAAPPQVSRDGSNLAAHNASLAQDIQELVNDIAGSPSSDSSDSSGSSSGSDSADDMQVDGAATQPAPTTHNQVASAAVSTPSATPKSNLPGQSKSARLPLPPNVPIPKAPAAAGRKANGGNKSNGRGAKNGSQAPANAPSAPANARQPPSGPKGQGNSRQGQGRNAGVQTYEGFLNDERRYTSEGKWEKFPDGSRIFVGNLSQERASKKDVFAMFHPYGRLAQISLKPAYGFVQYHTAAEAAEAIKHLQGVEVRGRKLNLEVSKTQKRSGKDRERSPERNDRNNKKANRKGDSYDGGRGTDGYRPNYDHRRRSRSRSRSRSPRPYSRSNDFRQRSPQRGSHGDGRDDDRNGRPRGTAPDVRLLLLQHISPDFVQYVQTILKNRGVSNDAMYVDPRMLDSIVQNQIAEGAHAVMELDPQCQTTGKVTIQTFARTFGTSHVSFEKYRDLDLNVAAELIVQAKTKNQAQQAYQPLTYPQQIPAGYPQQYQPSAYPPHSYGMSAAPAPVAIQAPALAGALSQVDPSILQQVLMSLQGGQPQAQVAAAPAAYGAPQPAHSPVPGYPGHAAPSQLDINAILNNLKSASASSAPGAAPGAGVYGAPAGYPGAISPSNGGPGNPPQAGGVDASQQVQNIMAQLARFGQ